MRPNSAIISVLCVAVVTGLAIWLAVEYQARIRLGQEQKILKQQSEQLASLLATNALLSNLVARASQPQPLSDGQLRELLRLRGEAGLLRQQTRELEAVRSENRQFRAGPETSLKTQGGSAAGAAATADYWPRDSWAWAGFASPDTALQSSLWAANNGDLKALLASTTGEMRKKIEMDFEGKSETEASIRAMDEVARIKSLRVINREFQADDTVVLAVTLDDGTDAKTNKLVLKKVGSDWKLSGPAQ